MLFRSKIGIDFHHRGRIGCESKVDPQALRAVERIAKGLGVDLAFASDPAAMVEINTNLGLARPLQITGTPAWVIGDRTLSGAVGYDALKDAVAAARAR